MEHESVSVLIGSRNRPQVVRTCIESVRCQMAPELSEILVLDDGSDCEYADEYASLVHLDVRIRCLRVEEPLGVAGGRNYLMRAANGTIMFFIDDDAVLSTPTSVAAAVQAFQSDDILGIVAGKIINHRDGREDLLVPFSRRTRRRSPFIVDTPQAVSYYLGGCHSIHRRVIETVGHYQEDLVFGEEELDLAYRAINAGFRIVYLPTLVAHHYPHPSVVKARGVAHRTELYHHVRNRFLLAWKYLPARYVVVYLTIWLSIYAWDAVRQSAIRDYLRGILHGIRTLGAQRRQVIRPEAISYLRRYHGRLWY